MLLDLTNQNIFTSSSLLIIMVRSQKLYSHRVHRLGIPRTWRDSKTILIHKKEETIIPSNFRPISLLNTLYKLYSGILSSKLVSIATANDWISKEQKGFLPGVRGIQEHTYVLESAIQESKKKKNNLFITWLDSSNAFGSIPQLFQLFDSLHIPLKIILILNIHIRIQNIVMIPFQLCHSPV